MSWIDWGERVGRPELSDHWKAFLFEHLEMITAQTRGLICRDPDDVMFLDCALGASAEFLVTGDDDLLSMRNVEFVQILTPADFMELNF